MDYDSWKLRGYGDDDPAPATVACPICPSYGPTTLPCPCCNDTHTVELHYEQEYTFVCPLCGGECGIFLNDNDFLPCTACHGQGRWTVEVVPDEP